MKYTLPIINLDHQWYLLQGVQLSKIDKPETLTGTELILTDFNDAVFGLENVSGPVEHAAALIEKRLRDIGMLDGPSKVIVHNTQKIGDITSVLFTAIPAESYAKYFQLVNNQKDHCLVVPLLSVLSKQVEGYTASSKQAKAFVFHHDREFDLIIVRDKHIVQVSRLTAFSSIDEDVNQTLKTLATEVLQQNKSVLNRIESIQWSGFLEETTVQNQYMKTLGELTDLEVVAAHHTEIIYQGREVKTVLPNLINKVTVKEAANDANSRFLFTSEKILPFVAAALLATILFFGGLLVKWNSQIKDIDYELAKSDKSKLQADIASIKSDLIQSNKLFANNANAQKISQWMYDLNGIQSAPDPKQLVDDIGSSLPEDVLIVGISLDSRRSPATVVLEGVIDKPLQQALKDLETMSGELLRKGYKMLNNSSIELSDSNDFRMTLKVDYYDK
jgi:hypothetical protein